VTVLKAAVSTYKGFSLESLAMYGIAQTAAVAAVKLYCCLLGTGRACVDTTAKTQLLDGRQSASPNLR